MVFPPFQITPRTDSSWPRSPTEWISWCQRPKELGEPGRWAYPVRPQNDRLTQKAFRGFKGFISEKTKIWTHWGVVGSYFIWGWFGWCCFEYLFASRIWMKMLRLWDTFLAVSSNLCFLAASSSNLSGIQWVGMGGISGIQWVGMGGISGIQWVGMGGMSGIQWVGMGGMQKFVLYGSGLESGCSGG